MQGVLRQIDSIPASRELDALVAEKVMGWTRIPCPVHAPGECSFGGQAPGGRDPEHIPPYSTSITAAWEIVNALVARDFRFLVNGGEYSASWEATHHANFCLGDDYFHGYGDTASLAICRAALHAVGAC